MSTSKSTLSCLSYLRPTGPNPVKPQPDRSPFMRSTGSFEPMSRLRSSTYYNCLLHNSNITLPIRECKLDSCLPVCISPPWASHRSQFLNVQHWKCMIRSWYNTDWLPCGCLKEWIRMIGTALSVLIRLELGLAWRPANLKLTEVLYIISRHQQGTSVAYRIRRAADDCGCVQSFDRKSFHIALNTCKTSPFSYCFGLRGPLTTWRLAETHHGGGIHTIVRLALD